MCLVADSCGFVLRFLYSHRFIESIDRLSVGAWQPVIASNVKPFLRDSSIILPTHVRVAAIEKALGLTEITKPKYDNVRNNTYDFNMYGNISSGCATDHNAY